MSGAEWTQEEVLELRRLATLTMNEKVKAWLHAACGADLEHSSAPSIAEEERGHATHSEASGSTPQLSAACVHSMSSAASASAPAPAMVVPAPTRVTDAGAPASTAAAAPARVYTPLSSWGWEQNNEYVEVLVLDKLVGVGSLPREQVQVDFTPSSFDVRVLNLGGKHYRLRVTNLEKDIVPSASSVVVKKNRISLKLRKAGQWDHWIDLVSKRKRKEPAASGTPAAGGAADPSASIMDMMKEMYDNGDDSTRKIIAEAWTKSRESQVKGERGAAGAFDAMAASPEFDY